MKKKLEFDDSEKKDLKIKAYKDSKPEEKNSIEFTVVEGFKTEEGAFVFKRSDESLILKGSRGAFTSIPFVYSIDKKEGQAIEENERIKELLKSGYILKLPPYLENLPKKEMLEEKLKREKNISLQLPIRLDEVDIVGYFGKNICMLGTKGGKCFVMNGYNRPVVDTEIKYTSFK